MDATTDTHAQNTFKACSSLVGKQACSRSLPYFQVYTASKQFPKTVWVGSTHLHQCDKQCVSFEWKQTNAIFSGQLQWQVGWCPSTDRATPGSVERCWIYWNKHFLEPFKNVCLFHPPRTLTCTCKTIISPSCVEIFAFVYMVVLLQKHTHNLEWLVHFTKTLRTSVIVTNSISTIC